MLLPPRRKTAAHQSRRLLFVRRKNAACCHGQNQCRAAFSLNRGLPRFPITPTAVADHPHQSKQNRQGIHARPNKATENIAFFHTAFEHLDMLGNSLIRPRFWRQHRMGFNHISHVFKHRRRALLAVVFNQCYTLTLHRAADLARRNLAAQLIAPHRLKPNRL